MKYLLKKLWYKITRKDKIAREFYMRVADGTAFIGKSL